MVKYLLVRRALSIFLHKQTVMTTVNWNITSILMKLLLDLQKNDPDNIAFNVISRKKREILADQTCLIKK